MELVIAYLLGCLNAILFVHIYNNMRKPSGTFIMDFSNPEEEFCKLVMDEDLNSIYTKKSIILRIDAKDFDDSQN